MKAAAAKLQEASKNDDGNAVVKTMWTDIASRQLMLRQAAEAMNAELRNEVVFHAKHAANLKRMLKRRYSEEMLELVPIEKRARSIVRKAAAADHRGMANLPCPGRDQKVNPKTVNGLFIELMDKNLVPFSTAQTSQAVWKAMCGQKTRDGDIVDAKPSSRSLGSLGLLFQETVVVVVRKGQTLVSGQETTVIESYLWATRCDDGKEIALKFRDAVFVDLAIEGWNKKSHSTVSGSKTFYLTTL
ncbi:hypothetical protein GQ600_14014 [Phytophthora cactorum]|nr:hypothetical protein GQ600_14014 [Phytophthora cactorum]